MSMDYLDDNIIDKEFENSVKMFSYEKRGLEFLKAYKVYVIDNVPGYSKLWKNFSWDLAFYRIKIIDKENHLFCYNQSSLGRAFTINFVKDIVTVNHYYDFVGQEFLTTEHLTKLWRILQC